MCFYGIVSLQNGGGKHPQSKGEHAMKTQTFGVEIELTGITRSDAAKVIANYYGTTSRSIGTYYDKYEVTDRQGRRWIVMSDGSIRTQLKDGTSVGSEYSCEVVTPICKWEDIEDIQEILRQLRENGAIANSSCGVHVHVGADQHTAKTLRNLVNIMASKEDLLFKALKVRPSREHYCKKADEGFVTKMNNKKPQTERAMENLWYEGYEGPYESRTDHYNDSRYHALNLHSLWQGKGIEFRCFNGTIHAGRLKTYIQLCLAISHQALTQHGASARKTASGNEKYTFRTWLLRMGMIGDEFETARKLLLENLNGDIAFRNGRPSTVA